MFCFPPQYLKISLISTFYACLEKKKNESCHSSKYIVLKSEGCTTRLKTCFLYQLSSEIGNGLD